MSPRRHAHTRSASEQSARARPGRDRSAPRTACAKAARGLLAVCVAVSVGVCAGACGGVPDDGRREAQVVQALVSADVHLLRTRPELVRGKYARMRADLYAYFRGSLAVFQHDWETGLASESEFADGCLPVWGLGDPHPENFGVLVDDEGVAALEPNDFDAADRLPYLFDVRRGLLGLAVGAHLADPDASVEPLAAAAAGAYAEALVAFADGAEAERVRRSDELPVAGVEGLPREESAILGDLFERSRKALASRAELAELTSLEGGFERRLRRGVLDPDEPDERLEDVPPFVPPALDALLRSLGEVPRRGRLLDVARVYGSGVSSWPRLRLVALLSGPSDESNDDLLLEVKELAESPLARWYAPDVSAVDAPARVRAALERAWLGARADPAWMTGALLGWPVQVRTESEAHKSVRVARWTGKRGVRAELERFGRVQGALLARVHAQGDRPALLSVAQRLRGRTADFAAEQARFVARALERVTADASHFTHALDRLGPTLGIEPGPEDRLAGPIAPLLWSPP